MTTEKHTPLPWHLSEESSYVSCLRYASQVCQPLPCNAAAAVPN